MRALRSTFAVVLVIVASLVMLSRPALLGAGGAPSPIPVSFGPNINLSAQSPFPGNKRETTVAANPSNPMNVVAGNIDRSQTPDRQPCTFSFTLDGGSTWTFGGSVPLPPGTVNAGDPALAADADGNFYYSFLADNERFSQTDVAVAKSTDGGQTFLAPSVVDQGVNTVVEADVPDKDYIGVDTWASSPFKGTVYVVWTNHSCNSTFTECDFQIMESASRDKGQTWSPRIRISPAVSDLSPRRLSGAVPVVGPDGAAYVFYDDFLKRTGPLSIMFSKSLDGGVTWSAPAAVASGLPSPGFILLKNADPNYGVTPFLGIPANSFPTAATVPDGTIFVAWTDVPKGSCHDIGSDYVPCTNTDVRLAVSRDGGSTWSAPTKVSDDKKAADQFFPWIAAHPNGLLSLDWYDKRLDPNNINYDVFYTNTFDGSTFLPNVRVTTQTSLSGTFQTFIQDYSGLAASVDGIFPVWDDLRTGSTAIYTATGRFTP